MKVVLDNIDEEHLQGLVKFTIVHPSIKLQASLIGYTNLYYRSTYKIEFVYKLSELPEAEELRKTWMKMVDCYFNPRKYILRPVSDMIPEVIRSLNDAETLSHQDIFRLPW